MAAVTVLLAVTGTALVVVRKMFVVVRVNGESMLPALPPGVRLLARRRRPAQVRRGDVVVTTLPPGTLGWSSYQGYVVKRVTAVPGDPVPPEVRPAAGVQTVPADAVVLRGDNAAASLDSRSVGFFAADRVLGVVVRRLRG